MGNIIRVWDLSTGICLLEIEAHSNIIQTAVFNQSGTQIVSASQDMSVKIWDIATGKCLCILKHTDIVKAATFN